MWVYSVNASRPSCELISQRSKSSCTHGKTFVCDDTHIQVSGGCRGSFYCHGMLVTCGDYRSGMGSTSRCTCLPYLYKRTSQHKCQASAVLDERPWTLDDAEAARRCLRGRRVWLLGNSVARHWAFVLVDLLLHNATSSVEYAPSLREDEKHRCGAGGRFGGQTPLEEGRGSSVGFERPASGCRGMCACDFAELDATLHVERALSFGWVWAFASNETAAALGGAGAPDVVVYNAGMPKDTCPPCRSDLGALREQGPLLQKLVSTFFAAKPGGHFYWRATTATCGAWEQFNQETARLNEAAERYACHDRRVRYMDGFNWTLGRCHAFDDRIHHSRLAFTHVTTFLRHECGL